MAIINVETSARFDFENLHVGKSWPTLKFSRFADKAKTIPEDFPYQDGGYVMEIYEESRYITLVKTIVQGPKLILDDNIILISQDSTDNTLLENLYHYRIVVTNGAEKIQVAHGSLKFVL